MSSWSVLLVAATAVHAGFQLTVSILAYPALARTAPDLFASAHERHSRAIVPLVGLVYGCLLVTVVGALLGGAGSVWVWVTAVATAVASGTTALRAAPLHARLGRRGPDPGLLRNLLRADRVRTLAALVGAAAAVLNAVSGRVG